MTKIAIIKKNDIDFMEMEKYAVPLLYTDHDIEMRIQIKKNLNDYIWKTIEPYIEFVNIGEDLLTTVCHNLTKNFSNNKNPDEFYYHTESSYSSPKKYLEIMYCSPLWKDYTTGKIENMNKLACLFSLKHNVIENNCVIIGNKYDTGSSSNLVLDNVTKDDIMRVIRRRYFFTASLIKQNSSIKYYYQNPAYLISKIFNLEGKDNIQKLSIPLFKYNLNFYCQQDTSKYINQIATRINGLYRLYGDVLILNELEENIYTNISEHEIKRLNVLSYGRLYDRQLKDKEIHEEIVPDIDENGKQIEKKKTPLWSKYIIVNNRMDDWKNNKNKCIYCGTQIKNPITCDKCFRAKYCSKDCEQQFNSYHVDECINPKSL
ncbi:zinc finger domain protein [Moumouvirus australiensis]|uniref:Zinc finger domain protein n=1 Tax=Moumouvirus australiensis TaxID=2109587 RepID=A0A2P1ELW7_9VIRU|nr:zinc finger domain protein [Moumouvirus australiensis]AVL94881.1 zinc finger domain protein [Moumouvirus australiensis]